MRRTCSPGSLRTCSTFPGGSEMHVKACRCAWRRLQTRSACLRRLLAQPQMRSGGLLRSSRCMASQQNTFCRTSASGCAQAHGTVL